MNGYTNSSDNHFYNSAYPYKVDDTCIHNGYTWRCTQTCTGIEPGSNYNYWNVTYTNPNLLINWDFTNPVNQRKFTATSTSLGLYTIDRWKYTDGGGYVYKDDTNHCISIRAGGVDDHQYMGYGQVIENGDKFYGKTLTASIILLDDTIYTFTTGVLSSSSDVSGASFNQYCYLNLFYYNNLCFFRIFHTKYSNSYMANIKAVKLELGPVSTLKNDILGINYASELIRCQRYYYRMNGNGKTNSNTIAVGHIHINGNAYCVIKLPTQMRTDSPIISYNDIGLQTNDGLYINDINSIKNVYNDSSVEGCTQKIEFISKDSNLFIVQEPTHTSYGYNKTVLINLGMSGFLAFDAEL